MSVKAEGAGAGDSSRRWEKLGTRNADRQVRIGTTLSLARNPALLSLLAQAGMDYVRLDMEHASPSIETVADMALVARGLGLGFVVRPPVGSREWITRLLDVGASGLYIPQVDTAAEARRVVDAARYAPQGHRGVSRSGPHNSFLETADSERLNAEVHLTVMLETAEGFEHADEILAVPGIDAVSMGPADLAQDLGVRGSPSAARILGEHQARMLQAARDAGKDVVLQCSTLEDAREHVQRGGRIVGLASEKEILQTYFAEAVSTLCCVVPAGTYVSGRKHADL